MAMLGPGMVREGMVRPGLAKGLALSPGEVVVPPPAGDIPTTMQSSITYRGRTYTLDAAHSVGVFEDGSPFIVSDSGGQITNTSLNSGDVEGDGYVGNGMMKNPGNLALGQGFDEYWSDVPFKTTTQIPYIGALNVDPGASNTATWAAGEKCSFVKLRRSPNKVSHDDGFEMVEGDDVITVLDAAPPVGTVRPCIQGTDKPLRSVNDVSFTPRGLTMPPSYGTIEQVIQRVPDLVSLFTENGEQRRITKGDTYLGTTSSGYSGEHTEAYAQFIVALNTTAPSAAQRDQMVAQILVNAGDVEGFLDLGMTIGAGAGQGGGLWLWMMAAGHMLGDDALLAKTRAAGMQPDTPFWTTANYVNVAAPPSNMVSSQTFFDEHIGMPHVLPTAFGSHHHERYFIIAAHIVVSEVMAILSFTGGVNTLLDGGQNDETNQYAAALGLLARYRTWNADWTVKYRYSTWVPETMALIENDFVSWEGPPEQPPMANPTAYPGNEYFTAGAGDGEIVLNDRGIDFATEAITQTDIEVSLDGTQWRRFSDVALTGGQHTLSGLLRGQPHWCRWRRHSASGTSPWSGNYPFAVTGGDDPLTEVVDTNGAEPASAPAFIVDPVICYRKYDQWYFPIWEEAPATGLGTEYTQLKAGLGYPSGSVDVDDYSFKWKRGGEYITDAIAQEYNATPSEDAAATLTCEITIDNGNGSVTYETPGVTLPDYPFYVVAQSSVGALDDFVSGYSKTANIGPAHPDRRLAFMIPGFHGGSAGVPDTVTIEVSGTVYSCSLAVSSGTGSGNGSFAQIWLSDAKIPTGTTGTLVISGGGTKVAPEVVRIIDDAVVFAAQDTFADSSSTSEVRTALLNGTAGGFVLGVIGTQGGSGGGALAFSAPDIELTALARDPNSQENVAFGLGKIPETGQIAQSWAGKNQNNHAVFATFPL